MTAFALAPLLGALVAIAALLAFLLVPPALLSLARRFRRSGRRRSALGRPRLAFGKELLATLGVLAASAPPLALGTALAAGSGGLLLGTDFALGMVHVGKGQTRAVLRGPFGPRFIGPVAGPGAISSHGDGSIAL
jgi:hypothetical protein